MKKTRNYKKITSIFLIFTIIIATLIMLSSSVFAQQIEVQPVVFVNVSPNPVGSGQTALITVQMDKTSPTVLQVEGENPFIGFTVTITKPDALMP